MITANVMLIMDMYLRKWK